MFWWPKLIEERKSKFNGTVAVYQFWGRYSLVVDRLTQSGGLVKNIWEQGLKAVKRKQIVVAKILVLGVGGGTVIALVRQLWPKAQVVGIEIDPVMLELGKQYFNLKKTSKVQLIMADATAWLKLNQKHFDLVLVDLYRGKTMAPAVASLAFLGALKRRLQPKGVAIINLLKMPITEVSNRKLTQKLQRVFSRVTQVKTPANRLLLVEL